MVTKQQQASEYVSVDEAAKILGVSRNSLYSAVQRKEIAGVRRVGKLIRIRRSALLED